MKQGRIKMFDPIKGFGFIVTDGEDELYFSAQDVHPKFRNVAIREGQKVGYDFKREIKGDRAVNVRLFTK